MMKHIASVHDGKKQLKCDICDSKYARNYLLNTYKFCSGTKWETKEEVSFKCAIYDFEFKQKEDLDKIYCISLSWKKLLASLIPRSMM